jgi:hypothetical protein
MDGASGMAETPRHQAKNCHNFPKTIYTIFSRNFQVKNNAHIRGRTGVFGSIKPEPFHFERGTTCSISKITPSSPALTPQY